MLWVGINRFINFYLNNGYFELLAPFRAPKAVSDRYLFRRNYSLVNTVAVYLS